MHGLLRKPPRDGDPVLVVGAGIIGLAALAAVRALFPACEVTITARHEHQAQAARAAGAHHVVMAQDRSAHFEELAAIAGATVSGRGRGQMLLGGFPYVIEAVGGLESVTESIRLVDYWGTVLFIGAGGMGEVDLSALWFKEAELVGAWNHSHGVHPTRGTHHSIDLALEVLANGGLPESVVTHTFALDELRDAVATAIDKRDIARDQGRLPPERLIRRDRLFIWRLPPVFGGTAIERASGGFADAVADAGALDEVGERDVLEHAPALFVDADPHLLQDAVPFAVVGVLRRAGAAVLRPRRRCRRG